MKNEKKTLLRTCVIVAAVLIVCCFAPATQANTLYVGNCHAGSYSTITLALAAATPGTIIDVCPGYYAEQVTITLSDITLQGIPYAHSGVTTDSAVIISPTLASPPGTWVQNGALFSGDDPPTTAAQIAVVGVTGVVISHITVDAANNSYDCGVGNLIGIYYENSTGTVTDSVARNQSIGNGDQCGWGIGTESNSGTPLLTVTNSSVHGFQKNGIAARGTNTSGPTLTATGNTVIGAGATSTLPGQNGIEIAFGATGSVKSNYVADLLYTPSGAATGILLYATAGSPIVETNTVDSANTGIAVVYDSGFGGGGSGATINSNHIGGTQMFDAIDLCGASETAKSNIIYNSTQSGVHLDDTCGGSSGTGDTVTGNTVNETCAGLLLGTSLTNTTNPNTYFNDGYEQLAGDTCTLPSGPNSNVAFKSEGQSAKKAGKPRP